MLLRVGPFVYRVEKVAGYIRFDGEECLGLCDNEAQVLYVSRRCSTAQQIQVLCHEYMEAWIYNFGQGELDKEAWCDLFGLAMTQFVMDLMQSLREQGASLWDDAAVPQERGETTAEPAGDAGRDVEGDRQARPDADAEIDAAGPGDAGSAAPGVGRGGTGGGNSEKAWAERVSARRARPGRVPIRRLSPIQPPTAEDTGPTEDGAASSAGAAGEAVRTWKNEVLRRLAQGFAQG